MPLDLENFFGMKFFTMSPDLEFFLTKISYCAPGLEKKFRIPFFFSLCSGTFFSSNFFTMLLDLEFIFEQKFFPYASGLRKIFEFHSFPLCPWTWKIFLKVKFFHYAPGLGKNFWKYFFHYASMLLDLDHASELRKKFKL